MKIFSSLTMNSGLEYSFSQKFITVKEWNSFNEVINLFRRSAYCSFERIIYFWGLLIHYNRYRNRGLRLNKVNLFLCTHWLLIALLKLVILLRTLLNNFLLNRFLDCCYLRLIVIFFFFFFSWLKLSNINSFKTVKPPNLMKLF